MQSAARNIPRLILPAILIALQFCRGQTPLSPFGVSMSRDSRIHYTRWTPKIAETGVQWIRGFAPMHDISSTKGVYDFALTDAYLSDAAQNGYSVIGMFNSRPTWISAELEFPVQDYDGWSETVKAIVTHCKNRVKYWEVWNEPPNFCNTDACTPANYGETVRITYLAAKSADPDAKIGLAAKSNFIGWLDNAIITGAKDHFDFIALHPYELFGKSVGTGADAYFMSIVPTVRTMLRHRNPAKENVPVIFTELGCDIGKNMGGVEITEHIHSDMLVKAYTMGAAQGVDGIYWFEVRDAETLHMGLLDGDRERPAFAALKNMVSLMGQNPAYAGWALLDNKHYAFFFTGVSQTIMVTWAAFQTSGSVDFGQRVEIMNPSTGTKEQKSTYVLTDSPVFIINPPQSLVSTAAANKNKPLSWGGDYSNADSVYIEFGDTNTERGLHHVYANRTSAAVTLSDGPARNCGIGRSQEFLIDPNFLSYHSIPLTITAVYKRNSLNDGSTGFNLKYESNKWSASSRTSFKSTGSWNGIPAGTDWITKSWEIDDSQFKGSWGFNFWFDSDGTDHSQYLLKSLSVKVDRASCIRRSMPAGNKPMLNTMQTAKSETVVTDVRGRILSQKKIHSASRLQIMWRRNHPAKPVILVK
jgi:hypothetical protein